METVRRLPWLLAGWGVALLAAGVVLYATLPPGAPDVGAGPPGGIAIMVLGVVALSVLGAFVASRQPRNAIGWAFLLAGVSFGYSSFAPAFVAHALTTEPSWLPLARWAAWAGDVLAMGSIWVPILLIPYAFPTGRLLSRRWWPGLCIGLFAIALLTLGNAFGPDVLPDSKLHLANPLAWPAGERVIGIFGGVIWLLPFISLVVGAISLIIRFRRSRDIERQQLKWISLSGVFVLAGAAGVLLMPVLHLGFFERVPIFGVLIAVGMGSMPITTSIAILRFRLYDVDRLLSRSVSYLIVTLVLGVLYGTVVLVPSVVFNSKRAPEFFTAVGTLLAAAAFVPVRRNVQRRVDRRFNRARYDAERTIERFASKLRLEFDVDALGRELAGVVMETMQPSSVGLWVRPKPPARLRPG